MCQCGVAVSNGPWSGHDADKWTGLAAARGFTLIPRAGEVLLPKFGFGRSQAADVWCDTCHDSERVLTLADVRALTCTHGRRDFAARAHEPCLLYLVDFPGLDVVKVGVGTPARVRSWARHGGQPIQVLELTHAQAVHAEKTIKDPGWQRPPTRTTLPSGHTECLHRSIGLDLDLAAFVTGRATDVTDLFHDPL